MLLVSSSTPPPQEKKSRATVPFMFKIIDLPVHTLSQVRPGQKVFNPIFNMFLCDEVGAINVPFMYIYTCTVYEMHLLNHRLQKLHFLLRK